MADVEVRFIHWLFLDIILCTELQLQLLLLTLLSGLDFITFDLSLVSWLALSSIY